MALTLHDAKGTPIDQQRFTWREMVQKPISKLDDDAFTRVRVILMNGLETDAIRLKHVAARLNRELRPHLADVRRVEHHQATLVNWLLGADHSPLETTIAYEQVAIEVTAAVAQAEPDPYLAQAYRYGLLEDFDHLYRYSALLDRLEGKDANNITQCYTDILPGRPTVIEHRHPSDDLCEPFDAKTAAPISKIHAALITASENQTHDYYMNVGPTFADPLARQLYAEIASIEEQHVTQYESLLDPSQTLLELWLQHEAMEAYAYYSCVQGETNPRLKAIWERMLDYELGHLQMVTALFQKYEKRDAAEVLPASFPEPVKFESQREFVRATLAREVDLRRKSTQFVPLAEESRASVEYRERLNADGSPSEMAAAGYRWTPGTELATRMHAKTASAHQTRLS
jgi:rubrerythrin